MNEDEPSAGSGSRKNRQSAVQPGTARGVKIAIGVGAGLLVLLTLAVWGLFEAFSS
jgi:threonine/homoserine/homoserine lactone efflux protein